MTGWRRLRDCQAAGSLLLRVTSQKATFVERCRVLGQDVWGIAASRWWKGVGASKGMQFTDHALGALPLRLDAVDQTG
jgi:hypothetical protein